MIMRISTLGLSALVLLASPLSAQTSAADEAVQVARTAAKADRHDEAIAAFRKAIALEPSRKREWIVELADQLTWSKRVDDAVALYSEAALTDNREQERKARIGLGRALSWAGRHRASVAEYDRALAIDSKHRDVRLAKAQVLAWDNRLDQSRATYEAVLRDYPGDAEALRGLARVLSWSGRHRAGIAAAEQILVTQPNDREAGIIRIESLDWMGRPDKALSVAREAAKADPENTRIAALFAQLKARVRPEARVDLRLFDQSDDLEISEASADLRVPVEAGRAVVGARYVRSEYRPDGRRSARITVDRPLLYAGYRLNDAIELNGAVALDTIDAPGAANDRTRFTFETYGTYRPNDILRFDAGISRWTFDSEATLLSGLTATQIGASVDVRPNERFSVSARSSRTTYSDNNRRWWWQAEAGHRILSKPNITLGYRFTHFTFRAPGQPGYYNPDRFRSHELLVRGYGQLSPRLRWDLRLIGGHETERPGGSRPAVNVGASLTQDIGKRFALEAAYDFSSSRSFATGGFERGIARLTLRARF